MECSSSSTPILVPPTNWIRCALEDDELEDVASVVFQPVCLKALE